MANLKSYSLLLISALGIFVLYTLTANSYPTTAASTPTSTSASIMSQYIVTLKENADDSAITKVKESIQKLGGEIVSEYSLIKGFVIKLPEIHTDSVKKLDSVATFEEDQEVKIQ
ncbi:uncharacterized protein KQ657_003075 [Scheffersomyces spartinae]|uniref:Inhibitor I9 domain-containing protein n=1 Tax=Scheffersomyces spartinae TaxID=45513 RepID=A0A9P7V585_9ASCO|nr:uncharacterized protein KQ657_003075 [Scheffersomyces spartinae]KAG7191480.1 hypothetical protein KQ657_003075 [Scheffersomyces spartinae]